MIHPAMLASRRRLSKSALLIFKRALINQSSLQNELTTRLLPLTYDYLTPQPSHLLNLSLLDVLPSGIPSELLHNNGGDQRILPSIRQPGYLPPGHHLVYFPPQVTLSELLPDGTDILHTPGQPFNRRLWAGGRISFPQSSGGCLLLDGQRAVCVERIENVDIKGPEGDEKILVTIDRRFASADEDEDELHTRMRIANDSTEVLVEKRTLVFMRDYKVKEATGAQQAIQVNRNRIVKSPTDPDIDHKMTPTKALLFRFSALTFNAHSIHLDPLYAQKSEGHHDLLIHGPLTLVLMLSVLSKHLSEVGLRIKEFEYRNLAPLHVDEELRICAKEKQNTAKGSRWEVWIEGPRGGLAVRGTAWTARSDKMDVFWAAPPISRTLTALTFAESLAVHSGFLSPYKVVFLTAQIFKFPPEPWRLITPFLLTKPRLEFLFDLYFMYTYSSGLEKNSPRFRLPGDFFVYLVFVCTVIMITAYYFLQAMFFTPALLMALIHTWSQDNRGRPVHLYVLTIKAELFPVALLVLSVVSDGWYSAMLGMIGIFASHLYDFLTRLWPTFGGGRNILVTPSFVHRLFGTNSSNPRVFGGSQSSGQSSARQGSAFGSSWSTRGAGRRLGGD